MDKFYLQIVNRLLFKGELHRNMSVLVVCGEELDAEVFDTLGFKAVTVTNLDDRHEGSWSAGAAWDKQDAETLSYADNTFDLVAVHLGLHHCRMPQKALCEMYRVARKGVLMIEPCENQMVKIGRMLGVGQEYEVHAVAFHHLKSGGVNNTPIPNYIYRWTPDEIRRIIASFAPEFKHRVYCKNNLVVHWHDLKAKKNRFRFIAMLFVFPFLKICSFILPGFGNNLGVYIRKAGGTELHPWLERKGDGILPDREWFRRRIPSA